MSWLLGDSSCRSQKYTHTAYHIAAHFLIWALLRSHLMCTVPKYTLIVTGDHLFKQIQFVKRAQHGVLVFTLIK